MSSRRITTDESKKKLEQEKLQAFLADLLREEDNRYCADCDAKGPRWASWSIGVFLCIRCAGIHRNLGVHLSKVKSVNLDSWTPEQVQSMRVIGNSVARAVYEAHIPEGFRRPASDQSMEAFVRAKYEHKRYIMKDWVKPKIDPRDLPVYAELYDIQKGAQKKQNNSSPPATTAPSKQRGTQSASKSTTPKGNTAKTTNGTVAPKITEPSPQPDLLDLVDLSTHSVDEQPVSQQSLSVGGPSLKPNISAPNLTLEPSTTAPPSTGSALDDLLGLGGGTSPVPPSNLMFGDQPPHTGISADPSSTTSAATTPGGGAKSKNDILALYGSSSSLGSAAVTSPMGNSQQHHQFGSFQQATIGVAQPQMMPAGGFPVGYSAVAGGYHMQPGGGYPPQGFVSPQHAMLMRGQQQPFGGVQRQMAAVNLNQPTSLLGGAGAISGAQTTTFATNLWQ